MIFLSPQPILQFMRIAGFSPLCSPLHDAGDASGHHAFSSSTDADSRVSDSRVSDSRVSDSAFSSSTGSGSAFSNSHVSDSAFSSAQHHTSENQRQQAHVIGRVVWHTQFDAEAQASTLQDFLSQWSHHVLPDILQTCFDALCPPEQYWRLSQITLDLADIPLDSLAERLPERLLDALQRALHSAMQRGQIDIRSSAGERFKHGDASAMSQPGVSDAQAPLLQVRSHTQTRDDLLAFVLQRGYLPWWFTGDVMGEHAHLSRASHHAHFAHNGASQPAAQQTLYTLIDTALQQTPQQMAAFVRRVGQQQPVRWRIAWQWGDGRVQQLFAALLPQDHQHLSTFREQLCARVSDWKQHSTSQPTSANRANTQANTDAGHINKTHTALRRLVNLPQRALRAHINYWMLTHVLVEQGSVFNQRMLVRSTLKQLADHCNVAFIDLLTLVQHTSQQLQQQGWQAPRFIQLIHDIAASEHATSPMPTTATTEANPLGLTQAWLRFRQGLQQRQTTLRRSNKPALACDGFEDEFLRLAAEDALLMVQLIRTDARRAAVREFLLNVLSAKAREQLLHLLAPQESTFMLLHMQHVVNSLERVKVNSLERVKVNSLERVKVNSLEQGNNDNLYAQSHKKTAHQQAQHSAVTTQSLNKHNLTHSTLMQVMWRILFDFLLTQSAGQFNRHQWVAANIKQLAAHYALDQQQLLDTLVGADWLVTQQTQHKPGTHTATRDHGEGHDTLALLHILQNLQQANQQASAHNNDTQRRAFAWQQINEFLVHGRYLSTASLSTNTHYSADMSQQALAQLAVIFQQFARIQPTSHPQSVASLVRQSAMRKLPTHLLVARVVQLAPGMAFARLAALFALRHVNLLDSVINSLRQAQHSGHSQLLQQFSAGDDLWRIGFSVLCEQQLSDKQTIPLNARGFMHAFLQQLLSGPEGIVNRATASEQAQQQAQQQAILLAPDADTLRRALLLHVHQHSDNPQQTQINSQQHALINVLTPELDAPEPTAHLQSASTPQALLNSSDNVTFYQLSTDDKLRSLMLRSERLRLHWSAYATHQAQRDLLNQWQHVSREHRHALLSQLAKQRHTNSLDFLAAIEDIQQTNLATNSHVNVEQSYLSVWLLQQLGIDSRAWQDVINVWLAQLVNVNKTSTSKTNLAWGRIRLILWQQLLTTWQQPTQRSLPVFTQQLLQATQTQLKLTLGQLQSANKEQRADKAQSAHKEHSEKHTPHIHSNPPETSANTPTTADLFTHHAPQVTPETHAAQRTQDAALSTWQHALHTQQQGSGLFIGPPAAQQYQQQQQHVSAIREWLFAPTSRVPTQQLASLLHTGSPLSIGPALHVHAALMAGNYTQQSASQRRRVSERLIATFGIETLLDLLGRNPQQALPLSKHRAQQVYHWFCGLPLSQLPHMPVCAARLPGLFIDALLCVSLGRLRVRDLQDFLQHVLLQLAQQFSVSLTDIIPLMRRSRTREHTRSPATGLNVAEPDHALSNALSTLTTRLTEKRPSMCQKISDSRLTSANNEQSTVTDTYPNDRQTNTEAIPDPAPACEFPIAVENAGLVILQSFFTPLFTRLQLIENGEFVSAQAQQDAAMTLQYLATGLTESEEQHLVLNKLLCGIALHQPTVTFLDLSRDDQDLCDSLLASMIDYWGAIGKSSTDGFRGNWLVRSGTLTEANDHWDLIIERRAYDVLLDRSPFSYSIIKLPWMPKPIYVTWPTAAG